jgi:hypothetical protein
VCGVLDGAPGAWPKFLAHWLLRSALIMPGLAIAGVRDKRLITGALASSTLVSAFLTIYTLSERSRARRRRSRSNGFAARQQHAFAIRKRRALAARKHHALAHRRRR